MTSDITNNIKNHFEHLNKNKKSWYISERDHYIYYCHLQRLTAKQAKTVLQSFGYTITDDIYYNVKKKMDKQSYKKLEYIKNQGFVIQHLERINVLETVQYQFFRLHNMLPEDKIMEKVTILEKIAALQIYIANVYEASLYFKDFIPNNNIKIKLIKEQDNLVNNSNHKTLEELITEKEKELEHFKKLLAGRVF